MTYATATIDPVILSQIPLKENQLQDNYQYPLDYRSVYEQIKRRSNNFTVEEPLARQADQMLTELLSRYKIVTLDETEVFQFQEAERQRQLTLLKIKFSLNLN